MRQGNFFQRHPGADFYSLFWLLVFLVLAGLGRLFPPLWIPALVALVYLLFRLFSKNAERRQMENARFLALFRSARDWFRGKKTIRTDSQYTYSVHLFPLPHLRPADAHPPGGGQGEDHLQGLLVGV